MPRSAAVALVVVALGGFSSCATAGRRGPSAVRAASGGVELVGHSVDGRRLVAHVIGDPAAPVHVLVVGAIHGDEPAGEAVTRALRGVVVPSGVALWLVDDFNPDGRLRDTRQNAHGVDLNRNAPFRWRRLGVGTFYSGPRPVSEPESRAINRLVRRIHPAVSIWYHQHAGLVDTSSGGSRALEARYARTVGLPLRRYPFVPGSITSWEDHALPGTTAFVVELRAGRLSAAGVAAHVRGVLALASGVAPLPAA